MHTCLAQDTRAESTGILLRVNRHPHLLARDGVLQQQVAAFAGPDLDEPGSLQLMDHFGPRHPDSLNLSLGFVKRVNPIGGCENLDRADRDRALLRVVSALPRLSRVDLFVDSEKSASGLEYKSTLVLEDRIARQPE